MSSRAVRTATWVRWAVALVVAPTMLITACSSDSSTPNASPTLVRTPVPLSSKAAAAAVRPNGVATCKLLPARRAQALLGGRVGAGTKDRRTNQPGRRQLDGCSYSNTTGTHLGFLVWQVTAPDKATVLNPLPPAQMGAKHFDPKIGDLSAGAVLTTGPMTVAQVNALRKGRLVQVSVTAANAARAKTLATSAARTIVGR
ncbi:MAG TPA: hypothetical protein VHN80_31130 [Kineosporiaceae bacterium]|nr:hypothetical protein [Kineosporiaceae bacterium]